MKNIQVYIKSKKDEFFLGGYKLHPDGKNATVWYGNITGLEYEEVLPVDDIEITVKLKGEMKNV